MTAPVVEAPVESSVEVCPNCQTPQFVDIERRLMPHKLPTDPHLWCAGSGYADFIPAPMMGRPMTRYIPGLSYDVRWLPAGMYGWPTAPLWTENKWRLQINQPAIFEGAIYWEHTKTFKPGTWCSGYITSVHRGETVRKSKPIYTEADFKKALESALGYLWKLDADAPEREFDARSVRRGSTLSSWPDKDIFGDEHDEDPDSMPIAWGTVVHVAGLVEMTKEHDPELDRALEYVARAQPEAWARFAAERDARDVRFANSKKRPRTNVPKPKKRPVRGRK